MGQQPLKYQSYQLKL